MAFVGPRLPLGAMEEHLHTAPHEVLPAWPHRGVKRGLLLYFNQLTCNRDECMQLQQVLTCSVLQALSRELKQGGDLPDSSWRVLNLSVLSTAMMRRATQIMHDCKSRYRESINIWKYWCHLQHFRIAGKQTRQSKATMRVNHDCH